MKHNKIYNDIIQQVQPDLRKYIIIQMIIWVFSNQWFHKNLISLSKTKCLVIEQYKNQKLIGLLKVLKNLTTHNKKSWIIVVNMNNY